MIRRGAALRWIIPAIGLATLAGCARNGAPGQASAPGLETVRLETDWYPQAEHGGFYQALAKGYYTEAGVNAVIIPGGPGITPLQALMSGYADLCVAPSDDAIVCVNNGLPVVIVGVYMEHNPQAIMVHEDDPIRSFKDLNDRTIMAAPEQDWIQYLRHHYHIEFRIIPLNFGLGEFMADKHFVQQCFVTNEPYFVRKNGGHARTLLIADSGYNPYRCLLATRHFIAEHPRAVREFVAASIRGWKDFIEGDPEPALKMIMSRNPQNTRDLMQFSVQAMRDQHIIAGLPELGEQVGLMTRRRLEDQARILAEIGITRSVLPVEKFATFDFQPDDLKALELR